MIRNHAFNSDWWGGAVGIVEDAERFLETGREERDEALRRYEWVELRMPVGAAPSREIAASGFFHADTQIVFRIGCGRVPFTASLGELTVERASETPFSLELDDLEPFEHERYRHLPGVDQKRLQERYALWAGEQIARSPEWCVRIKLRGVVQGWFLSRVDQGGLNLELAMLSRGATVSGMYLYQRSIAEYARYGARVGHARFSVENTDILNIYSRLGAQFLAPLGTWLWIR